MRGRAHSLSDIAFLMPAAEMLQSDVGSSCAADREDPTSQKRAVVERDASKAMSDRLRSLPARGFNREKGVPNVAPESGSRIDARIGFSAATLDPRAPPAAATRAAGVFPSGRSDLAPYEGDSPWLNAFPGV